MVVRYPVKNSPDVSRVIYIRKPVETNKNTVLLNEVAYSGDLFTLDYTVKGINKDCNVRVFDDKGKECIVQRNDVKSGVWLKDQVDGYEISLADSKFIVVKVDDEEVKVNLKEE